MQQRGENDHRDSQTVTIASQSSHRDPSGDRRRTATRRATGQPRHRLDRTSIKFMRLHICELSDSNRDSNPRAQPHPSTHNGVAPTLIAVAPLRCAAFTNATFEFRPNSVVADVVQLITTTARLVQPGSSTKTRRRRIPRCSCAVRDITSSESRSLITPNFDSNSSSKQSVRSATVSSGASCL